MGAGEAAHQQATMPQRHKAPGRNRPLCFTGSKYRAGGGRCGARDGLGSVAVGAPALLFSFPVIISNPALCAPVSQGEGVIKMSEKKKSYKRPARADRDIIERLLNRGIPPPEAAKEMGFFIATTPWGLLAWPPLICTRRCATGSAGKTRCKAR